MQPPTQDDTRPAEHIQCHTHAAPNPCSKDHASYSCQYINTQNHVLVITWPRGHWLIYHMRVESARGR